MPAGEDCGGNFVWCIIEEHKDEPPRFHFARDLLSAVQVIGGERRPGFTETGLGGATVMGTG